MDSNEYSQLFQLKSPCFPALGKVFIAVSSGDYRVGGIPHFFGEFFIFSTKGFDGVVSKRTYIHQHLTKNGTAEIFELAKTRAVAELSDQIIRVLNLSTADRYDKGFEFEIGSWDDVAALYRAGVCPQEIIRDIESKTRSTLVVNIVREITSSTLIQFEEARNR